MSKDTTSRAKTTRLLLMMIGSFAVLAAFVLIAGKVLLATVPEFGPGYDATLRANELRLLAIAATADPLRTAVASFAKANGKLPATLDELVPKYLDDASGLTKGADPPNAPKTAWVYERLQGNSFTLTRKLGWDASIDLRCDADGNGAGKFNPGDGSPAVDIFVAALD